MKKWLLLIGLVIALVACNNEEPVNENNNVNENNQEDVENNDNNDDNENEEKNDENVENNENNTNENYGENGNQVENNENNDNNNNSAENLSTEDILVEKVYDIFAAQRNDDYDYLLSVLAEGAELDEENNTFIFNDVAHPHEQPFLDEVAEDDLEFRYTHEEDDTTMIVGFAAIDYENESSFVIDFEFILDGDEWKMKDMDLNK